MALQKSQMVNKPATLAPGASCPLLPEGGVLLDYLTQEAWEDGTERRTATISISYGSGRYLLTIRDRAARLVGFVSGETLSEAWESLSESLEADKMTWRKDTWAGKEGAAKK